MLPASGATWDWLALQPGNVMLPSSGLPGATATARQSRVPESKSTWGFLCHPATPRSRKRPKSVVLFLQTSDAAFTKSQATWGPTSATRQCQVPQIWSYLRLLVQPGNPVLSLSLSRSLSSLHIGEFVRDCISGFIMLFYVIFNQNGYIYRERER